MGFPWYCTVEDVKSALDSKETARNEGQIRRAIESASRTIEGDMHRRFYPATGTRYFDWPSLSYPTPWVLWLDEDEVTAVTALTSGGVTISTANLFLEPSDLGPPYNRIEIDRSTATGFDSGSTPQRAIAVTGTFGYCSTTESAGALAAAITTTSATTCTVTDSSLVGTGDTILVDSERMRVTRRSMTTTSQTLQTPITASVGDVTVAVTTGTSYAVGEVLLLDSERMLVVDQAGNNLTVKRAWDGSVLAAHTGSTIYAPRLLTLERGFTGTTAATHLISAAVSRLAPPGPIRDLAIAEAMNRLLQEGSGYARTVGSGDNVRAASGGALAALWKQTRTTYQRTRIGAV